jgi:hypothetical protein
VTSSASAVSKSQPLVILGATLEERSPSRLALPRPTRKFPSLCEVCFQIPHWHESYWAVAHASTRHWELHVSSVNGRDLPALNGAASETRPAQGCRAGIHSGEPPLICIARRRGHRSASGSATASTKRAQRHSAHDVPKRPKWSCNRGRETHLRAQMCKIVYRMLSRSPSPAYASALLALHCAGATPQCRRHYLQLSLPRQARNSEVHNTLCLAETDASIEPILTASSGQQSCFGLE